MTWPSTREFGRRVSAWLASVPTLMPLLAGTGRRYPCSIPGGSPLVPTLPRRDA